MGLRNGHSTKPVEGGPFEAGEIRFSADRLRNNFTQFSIGKVGKVFDNKVFEILRFISVHHILPYSCSIIDAPNQSKKAGTGESKRSVSVESVLKYLEDIQQKDITDLEKRRASVRIILSGLQLMFLQGGTHGIRGAHCNDPRNGCALPGDSDLMASECLAIVFNTVTGVRLPVHYSSHLQYNNCVMDILDHAFQSVIEKSKLKISLDHPESLDIRRWGSIFADSESLDVLVELQHAYVETMYFVAYLLLCVPNDIIPDDFPEELWQKYPEEMWQDLSMYMRLPASNSDQRHHLSSLTPEQHRGVVSEEEFYIGKGRHCKQTRQEVKQWANDIQDKATREGANEYDIMFNILKILAPILYRANVEAMKITDDGINPASKISASDIMGLMLQGNEIFYRHSAQGLPQARQRRLVPA